MSFLDGFLTKKSSATEPPAAPGEEQVPENTAQNTAQNAAGEISPAPSGGGAALSDDEKRDLGLLVVEALREIYDPEIPVNIYELGLVYDVLVSDQANVHVVMTLTTPHCPVAESMPGEVEMRVRDVAGVGDVTVELVWDPPWDMSMMSEAARLEMGFM